MRNEIPPGSCHARAAASHKVGSLGSGQVRAWTPVRPTGALGLSISNVPNPRAPCFKAAMFGAPSASSEVPRCPSLPLPPPLPYYHPCSSLSFHARLGGEPSPLSHPSVPWHDPPKPWHAVEALCCWAFPAFTALDPSTGAPCGRADLRGSPLNAPPSVVWSLNLPLPPARTHHDRSAPFPRNTAHHRCQCPARQAHGRRDGCGCGGGGGGGGSGGKPG